MPKTPTARRLIIHCLAIVGILLLIFISRIRLLNTLEFNIDEIWSVWSTNGSLPQVFDWIAYDWVPAYPIFVWFWQHTVGITPFVLRFSSVLLFMVACAWTYRAAYSMSHDRRIAWGALLAYAGLGYSVFLSTYFRGYALLLMLLPLALWLTETYFQKPSWRWAMALAILMNALFYTHLTSVLAFIALGIYTLLVYSRHIWRWGLVALFAIPLAMPIIIAKLQVLQTRQSGTWALLPLSEAFVKIFNEYFGVAFVLWLLGLAIIVVYALITRQKFTMRHLAFFLWASAILLVVYFFDTRLGFFSAQYSWWVLLGIALGVTYLLRFLPARIWIIACAVLLGASFLPIDSLKYSFADVPYEATMRELVPKMVAGDVIYRDPNCNCGGGVQWWYYAQVFFPQGILIVDDPTGYQRVWYVSSDGSQDARARAQVNEGRLASQFVGPWNFLFRLYEAPPDVEGIVFENGMRFHGYQLIQNGIPNNSTPIYHEGDTVTIRLWWSVDQPLERDYSVGLYTFWQEYRLFNNDSAPQVIQIDATRPDDTPPQETSRWQVGQYYVEERQIVIPLGQVIFEYDLYLSVYQWWDNVRLSAQGVDAENLLRLGIIATYAW